MRVKAIRVAVSDSGGGTVTAYVDRDAEEYPPLGVWAVLSWEVEDA